MPETLSEGYHLRRLDLEMSRNNYSPGTDYFDVSDLRGMKKIKECSRSVAMLEKVRSSQPITKRRNSKILSDNFILGYGVEGYVIENVSPPPKTCTSYSSSESFDSDHQLCSLGSQTGLELFFHNEFFGDENNKHRSCRIPTMSYDGRRARNGDDDENETKQTNCLAYASRGAATLPTNCIHPKFGNVNDAVSTAAAAEYFTFSLPCKTSWSTGKTHHPSIFEEKNLVEELSPRMQRKLANLKSFRSKSFGGRMYRKPLRNVDIKNDRHIQSQSFNASKKTAPSTANTSSLPLTAPPSRQQQQRLKKPTHMEFHYDAEVGEAKMNMQAIDKAEIHQSPKIFSSRSEKTLFHGGGHESKQNICSTLVTRIEGEIIESDMKPHQVRRVAIAKFNVDPEDCISYLVTQGLLKENCPEDMCNFILSEPGLSKRKLGEMYGKVAVHHVNIQLLPV